MPQAEVRLQSQPVVSFWRLILAEHSNAFPADAVAFPAFKRGAFHLPPVADKPTASTIPRPTPYTTHPTGSKSANDLLFRF